MKKLITSLSLLTLSLLSFGQSSLQVLDLSNVNISNSIFPVALPPNTYMNTSLLVTNTSTTSHSYKCKRTIFAMASDDSTQFMWGGLHYNWSINVSSGSLTIVPGDTVDYAAASLGFNAVFISHLSSMTRYVHYQFYDAANPNDSTGVTIQYNSVLGVDDMSRIGGAISNAFPNPANSNISVEYDMNAYSKKGSIVFYDMLGKEVKEIALTDKKGVAKISVGDLNAGVYFYSFFVDRKAISTKKLVINSK